MFKKHDATGYKELVPGIRMKTLNYGDRTLMAKFLLEEGSRIPDHAHPHEQAGYLVTGKLRFRIDGEYHDAEPGDSWCIAGDVVHSVRVLAPSVIVEVFSPVREEYLP
jgi:quercetin dioxygenase-like cupin family protein